MRPKIVIIGGGPAGLTAAYEIVKKDATRYDVIVFEACNQVGGLCKTIDYKGNKIDIGGHRFYSKSETVMEWWKEIMPFILRDDGNQDSNKSYLNGNGHSTDFPSLTTADNNNVMLVKKRMSRIYYKKKFYEYPLTLNWNLFRNIGFLNALKILYSYMLSKIRRHAPETSLERFFINRFGSRLYYFFFKDYTEKVWGKPCSEISPEWGAQRIKQLSISKIFTSQLYNLFSVSKNDVYQKNVQTSLIKYFLYPKFGPGQMWELVEQRIVDLDVSVKKEHVLQKIVHSGAKIMEVHVLEKKTNKIKIEKVDHLISSMAINEFINCMDPAPPDSIKSIAANLEYRDFMIVGVLLKKFESPSGKKKIIDNWIYINDPDVKVGRIQIFNNWSIYMVRDPATFWIGMEYFVNKTEELWNMPDGKVKELAYLELVKMGFCELTDVLDAVVIRVPMAYPGYFGAYKEFYKVKNYLNQYSNLFLIGRNGMHKYNNQDHSMLAAIEAVKNIFQNIHTKENIWTVNSTSEYMETK